MIQRYYEDEMRYLHEAAKAFAQVHPEQARYLNIDSLTSRDPHVERLFEGFAFLTARIRERLDDELPQYTEGLLRLLYPHLVKPVPALSILEFTPRPGMLQQTKELPPGTEVRSKPVGEEATVCRFTTAWPVQLQPMKLMTVRLEWPGSGTSCAALHFQLDRSVDYQKLDLKRLRLYFHAEPGLASLMHLFFTRHVVKVTFEAGGEQASLFGQQWVQPAGLGPKEGLLPYSRYTFAGHRLVQEYFSFRPKFWFVDILGFDRFAPPAGAAAFQVQVCFNRAFPEDRAFTAEQVRLYCTPIVNLFEADAEPVRVEHLSSEYRVIADVRRQGSVRGDQRRPASVTVYDVLEVTGMEDATGRRHAYRPFFAFTHAEGKDRFYAETARFGPTGTRETYISLGGFGAELARVPAETLSVRVRCTNGNLPHEALQEGGIKEPAPGYANVASFQNLMRPTRELQAPVDRHRLFFWKLLSHLSLNHLSAATPEALAGLLPLYDWTDADANQRRIAGIREVSWKPKEVVRRGAVLRGAEVTLEVQDGHFADDGDLNLFGTIMSAFFTMYATINAFVHLRLVSVPSGASYHWQPLKGELPIA